MRSGKSLMIGFMKRFSEPYRRARELNIAGRSKMGKDELKRAVAKASS